jgi:hypothetical protein
MKCHSCGSEKVRRSQRQGIREGILLRLALAAPYRCHDCDSRFIVFDGRCGNLLWNREESFAEFIGLRGRDYEVRRWIFNATITLILLGIAITFLLRIIRP